MNLAAKTKRADLLIFLQETDELLQLLDEDIVKLEHGGVTPDLLNEIFRAAHTIKGSAAMIGHQRMSELAHAMETVLDGLRKGVHQPNTELIDALLASLDTLKALKEELTSPQRQEVDISLPVSMLKRTLVTTESTASSTKLPQEIENKIYLNEEIKEKIQSTLKNGERVFLINAQIDKNSSWNAVRCFQILTTASKLGKVIHSVPTQKEIEEEKVSFQIALLLATSHDETELRQEILLTPELTDLQITVPSLTEQPTAADDSSSLTENQLTQKPTGKKKQTIRIDIERLDNLMEQIGELVVNRNRLAQLSKLLETKYKGDETIDELEKNMIQTTKVVNILQQDITKIRMLPLEIVFNGFPRMVRDLARKADKKIDFFIEGQETEVDRSIIEHIKDPLIHLLRNAVDHGIEPPEQRIAAGKPATGTIVLSAYHEQNHITITITDDGKGLDPVSIKHSAVQKGIISPERAARLSDTDAIELIFLPGLSTAQKATEVSGRGVGLDVVKTNIEALRGSVTVSSEKNKGTKFTLRLPLTLAILPALLLEAEKTLCAIPLADVIEAAKVRTQDLKTIRGNKVIMWRDTVLSVLDLAMIFGWRKPDCNKNGESDAVIVKAGGLKACLIADSLKGQQEIVLKPLGNYLGDTRGIAGASILGDGNVILVLDIATLLSSAIGNKNYEKEYALS